MEHSYYNLCRFSDIVLFGFGYAGGANFASSLIDQNRELLNFDKNGNIIGTNNKKTLVANVTKAIRERKN